MNSTDNSKDERKVKVAYLAEDLSIKYIDIPENELVAYTRGLSIRIKELCYKNE